MFRIVVPRAPAHHLVFLLFRSERVLNRRTLVITAGIPVRHPFPDIAGHVERIAPTGSIRKTADRHPIP